MATPPRLDDKYFLWESWESYESGLFKHSKEFTQEEVSSSLKNVYNFLKKKIPITEKDLYISNYAFKHLADNSENCKKKIQKIQNRIKKFEQPLSETPADLCVKKLKSIFLPSETNAMIIVDANQNDVMSQELKKLKLIEFFNTRWIMLGATLEDLNKLAEKEQAKSAEESPTALGTTPPPRIEVIPDPNLQTRLLCWNETEKRLELQPRTMRENQKEIITLFGYAIFNDYILHIVPWIKDKFIDLLKDKFLAMQVGNFQTNKLKAAPVNNTKDGTPEKDMALLLTRILLTQATHTLEAIHENLYDISTREELRNIFPDMIFRFLPPNFRKDMNPEVKKMLAFLLKNYFPDMMEAAMKRLKAILSDPKQKQKLGEYLIKVFQPEDSNYNVELIQLIAFVLQNNIPGPAESASEVLLEKLKDQRLNTELTALLKNILLDSFFPKPVNVTDTNKKVIVAILASIKEYLANLNSAIGSRSKAPTSLPDPQAQIAASMYQHLFLPAGIFYGKAGDNSIQFNEYHIRAQLEDLLLLIIFPETKPADATFTQKIIVMSIAAFAHKILSDIFKPDTFQIIFERLLADPLFLENPFEPNQPSHDFDDSDKEFSKNLDINIKAICTEVVKLSSDNYLFRKAGETALGLIPSLGDRVQRELNKIFNSGVSLVPILYPMQVFYKLKPARTVMVPSSMSPQAKSEIRQSLLQERFFKTLTDQQRVPVLKNVMMEKTEEAALRKQRLDKQILGEDQRLEKLIEKVLPFGTRDLALDLLRKLYVFSTNDLILKILLIYIIDGLKKGLTKEGK